MTSSEIAVLVGYLVSAWSMGFTGGYLITKYRDALYHVS